MASIRHRTGTSDVSELSAVFDKWVHTLLSIPRVFIIAQGHASSGQTLNRFHRCPSNSPRNLDGSSFPMQAQTIGFMNTYAFVGGDSGSRPTSCLVAQRLKGWHLSRPTLPRATHYDGIPTPLGGLETRRERVVCVQVARVELPLQLHIRLETVEALSEFVPKFG
mmetsp:Transcript_9036/g.22437  ORF Transcript_9036/g.22437 Transcript_9036/m.22437 type:complete len:165 (+) Transcript_9036:157-651(+)